MHLIHVILFVYTLYLLLLQIITVLDLDLHNAIAYPADITSHAMVSWQFHVISTATLATLGVISPLLTLQYP